MILACPGAMPVHLAMMTPQEYQERRETVGSQRDVSVRLGVNIRTVQRRETGEIKLTREAVRSLNALNAIDRIVHLSKFMRDGDTRRELLALSSLLESP